VEHTQKGGQGRQGQSGHPRENSRSLITGGEREGVRAYHLETQGIINLTYLLQNLSSLTEGLIRNVVRDDISRLDGVFGVGKRLLLKKRLRFLPNLLIYLF